MKALLAKAAALAVAATCMTYGYAELYTPNQPTSQVLTLLALYFVTFTFFIDLLETE